MKEYHQVFAIHFVSNLSHKMGYVQTALSLPWKLPTDKICKTQADVERIFVLLHLLKPQSLQKLF